MEDGAMIPQEIVPCSKATGNNLNELANVWTGTTAEIFNNSLNLYCALSFEKLFHSLVL